ncbi:cytochrome c [Amaricoccus solimangrovi]
MSAWRSWSTREEPVLLAWDDANVVARGRTLYVARCAGCHGALGEGQSAASGGDPTAGATVTPAPPHDASGHTWQHPDFALVQLTKSGRQARPAAPSTPPPCHALRRR